MTVGLMCFSPKGGYSPLTAAVYAGNTVVVESLLRCPNIDIDYRIAVCLANSSGSYRSCLAYACALHLSLARSLSSFVDFRVDHDVGNAVLLGQITQEKSLVGAGPFAQVLYYGSFAVDWWSFLSIPNSYFPSPNLAFWGFRYGVIDDLCSLFETFW